MGYIFSPIFFNFSKSKHSIQDYAVTGMGYMYAYIDRESDFGRGDAQVKLFIVFKITHLPAQEIGGSQIGCYLFLLPCNYW